MAIGVDLGGTNVRGVRVDGAGKPDGEHRVPVGAARSPEAIVRRVAEVVEALGGGDGACVVGLGFAGWVDAARGFVHNAPNLGWVDVDLRALLAAQVPAANVLVNDLTAITYGEWRAGAGRGSRNLLCVFVGSGLGAGMVLEGRLYEGSTGIAGELGHIPVVRDGLRCGCGLRGCLEPYVGGRYLEERARRDLGQPTLTCGDLEAAFRQGDADARQRWEDAAYWLAVGITSAIKIVNPDRLVLGGGVMAGCPGYRALALQALHEICPTAMLAPVQIVPPELGGLSGAVGAALLARDRAREADGS